MPLLRRQQCAVEIARPHDVIRGYLESQSWSRNVCPTSLRGLPALYPATSARTRLAYLEMATFEVG
jgi:hypothetical protein